MLVYLSHWYRPADRAKAMALFFAGIPLAQVVGGPLAAVLLRLHWMRSGRLALAADFGGLPALLLGVVTIFYLTEHPRRRQVAAAGGAGMVGGGAGQGQAAACRSTRPAGSGVQALADPRVLLLSMILFLGLNSNYGVGLWLPKMVQKFSSFDVSTVSLIATIPSLCSLPAMFLVGWHSDKTGERIWHTAIPRFLSAAALVVCFFSASAGESLDQRGDAFGGDHWILLLAPGVLALAQRVPGPGRGGGEPGEW